MTDDQTERLLHALEEIARKLPEPVVQFQPALPPSIPAVLQIGDAPGWMDSQPKA